MDLKNKKSLQKVTSFSGFVCILTFYITRHASFSVQMLVGGLLTIISLSMFVCTICIRKLRKAAGFMFILFLIPAVATLGTYLDFKNANNHFLLIIILLLFILVIIFGYRVVVKEGDIEKIKDMKKKVIIGVICWGSLLLLAVYWILFPTP